MSRISASLTSVTTDASNTSVTINATGRFKYASGTWGYTVDGYLSINGNKKTISDARGTTSGGTFGTTSHSVSVARGKSSKSITVKLYGYCDESTSDTATATKTVTVNPLASYKVTCDGTAYTKWYGETLTLPQPTRANYTFGGWTDGSSTYSKTYTKNAAATLTAVWIPNTIAPTINNSSAVRSDANKTTVNVVINYTDGKNADSTDSPVTRLKLDIKNGDTWTNVFDVTNPPNPFSGTLTNISESNFYDLRWTIFDANYPNGVMAYDFISKTAYIWRATGDGLDFGVPVTMLNQAILTGSEESGKLKIGKTMVQWGRFLMSESERVGTGTNPYTYSKDVVFDEAFAESPETICNFRGNYTNVTRIVVYSGSESHANIYVHRTAAATTGSVSWIAIGRAAE